MKIKGFQDTINWYNKNAYQYASNSIQNLPSIGLDDFVKEIPTNFKVLDAGCAAGRDTKRLKDRGINAIGIDLSSELIKVAKKNNPDIEFIEGNFLHLPFPPDSFGGVWAHASLLHFETVTEVISALKEFNRILTNNGIVHIFVKEKTTDKKFDIVSDKLSHHNRFFQYFTKEEIEDYVRKAGFTILKIEEYNDPAKRKGVRWILCLAKKI